MGYAQIFRDYMKTHEGMKILREYNGYTLIEKDTESTLRFYLDDGDEVSEYFDCIEADDLLKMTDTDFENHCIEVFRPSFKLIIK